MFLQKPFIQHGYFTKPPTPFFIIVICFIYCEAPNAECNRVMLLIIILIIIIKKTDIAPIIVKTYSGRFTCTCPKK